MVSCEINSRDHAEALIDAACYHMAKTNSYGHLYDATMILVKGCGIREAYVLEEIERLKQEL